jgi:hypothetical protein
MRQLPEFITFTGYDADTNIEEMAELSGLYPIEWAVLVSPKRQGVEPRYPDWRAIQALLMRNRLMKGHLTLAVHICGAYSREIMETGQIRGLDPVLGRYFHRAQINLKGNQVDRGVARAWAKRVGVQVVLQHGYTDGFVCSGLDEQLLFDMSGGRGLQPVPPEQWPHAGSDDWLYGYAGGINQHNARSVVDAIGQHATRYWIDMESGVRDENDRFDLERCRAVCEAVYGKSLFA